MRSFPTYEQFLVLAFAQLTYRESLRDIETCLGALGPKLYHSGIRQPTARSTLADANEKRDWRDLADFAQVLIAQATLLYADEPFGVELKEAAYALDSTTIDLCLSFFPWAKFRRHKAAVKLHTLLALRGNFPTVVIFTTGRVHDVNILDQLSYEPGSSISSIAATWISPALPPALERGFFCDAGQEELSLPSDVTRTWWTKAPVCVSTRPSS